MANLGNEELVIEFLEPEGLQDEDSLLESLGDSSEMLGDEPVSEDAGGVVEFLEPEGIERVDVKDVGDEISEFLSGDMAKDVEGFISEYSEEVSDTILVPGTPGALMYDPDDVDEEPETSWEDDRDSSKFMEYLTNAYPAGIPQHDGNSMVGCERAALYLGKLNNEISEALRLDSGDSLDAFELEDYRVKIMSDLVLLKNRLSDLKKQLNQSERSKLATDGQDIVKEATTPRVQLVVTPFERAISGILVNAVVSGGKPFEDVYDYLKGKYSLDEREELTIMQLLMDSGYHIFKDRGVIGSSSNDLDSGGNPSLHGVDFIKNYFS